MSRERNVFGIVLITMCLTSAALVAGWFGAQRYFAQQAAAAPPQEAPTPAPAPRKKTRAAKSDTGRGAVAEAAAANDAATAAAPAPKVDAAVARADSEPSTAAAKSPPPAAENEPARTPASESAAPAPEPAAPAATDHADGRTIMEEAQRRTTSQSQRYEGRCSRRSQEQESPKSAGISSDRFAREEQVVVRFTAPRRSEGRGAVRAEPSGPRFRSMDVDAGHRARAPDRATGSIDAFLRHRLQLRRPGRARRRTVRLLAALARRRSTARLVGKFSRRRSNQSRRNTPIRSSGSARTTMRSRGSNLRERTGRAAAELHRHPRTCRASGPPAR